MSASERSVVVGDQRALVRDADEPVVPDAGRESEQPLSDPHHDAAAGAAAVLFEPELTFEGVVDGLDTLTEPAQLAVALPLTTAIGPDERGAEFTDEGLELPPGVPLVSDDEQAAPERPPSRDHGAGDFPGAQLGVCRAPGAA